MIAGRRPSFIIAILDPERKGKERDDQRDDKTRRPLQSKGRGQRKDSGVGGVASRARQTGGEAQEQFLRGKEGGVAEGGRQKIGGGNARRTTAGIVLAAHWGHC